MNGEFDAGRLARRCNSKWIVRIVGGPPRHDVNTYGAISSCCRFQGRSARSSGPRSG